MKSTMFSYFIHLGLLYCLFKTSAAVSHRALRLYEHAYEALDAGSLNIHDETAIDGFALPGADKSIPIIWQTFPKTEVLNETAEFFPQRGSVRNKVRYGPFTMDSMDKHEGMVDYLQVGAQMPCHNCTITFIQASLEYTDGGYANANTSAWLHHCVLININRHDTVCGTKYYGEGQRWFASGNERTPVSLSLNGQVPAGYYIGPGDLMVLETELMNQAMYDQTVFVTITYEWIPGPQSDFYDVAPIWMDIAGCIYASDMPVKTEPAFTEETVFSYTSPTYVSALDGVFLGMGGHLHDGGTSIEIYQDLAFEMCNSVAEYGGTPGYIDAPGTSMLMPMSPMFSPMKHISKMTYCYAPILNTPTITQGSLISITGHYDLSEHMPMLTLDGDYDEIMAIAVLYVAVNMTMSTMTSLVGNTTLPLQQTTEMDGMEGMDMMLAMTGHTSMGAMSCVPMRDSPGTITLKNLNTTDPATMNALLAAIMCDSCLQAWSAPYARYLWYGIVVAIACAGFSRLATWQSHLARKSRASQLPSGIWQVPDAIILASSRLARLTRIISYKEISPRFLGSMFQLPPLGIILMVIGYFGFLLTLQFTHASTGDLQTWQFLSVRAGWLSVAQLPLIVLLSTKRNFVTMLTAVTYERLNVLHRWISRALLMTALMHLGFQWHGWSNAGVVPYEMSDTCIPTGSAALALVLWMNLSTLAPFRRLSYEFFVLQHLVTFFGTIIAIAYHIPSTAPYALTYVYITSALYLVTKIFQGAVLAVQLRRRPLATVTTITPRITKIVISPSPCRTWKVGSFVRLTIPKLGLLQSHPMTIASTPTSHSGDLVFYLLSRGGFTRTIAHAKHQSRDHRAIVDGPYGGSQHDMAAFDTTVLIAGSVGITFTLSLLLDLAHRSARVQLPVRRLVFVWTLRDGDLARALYPEILQASDMLLVAGVEVSVLIHITAAPQEASSTISTSAAPVFSSDGDIPELSEKPNFTSATAVEIVAASDNRPTSHDDTITEKPLPHIPIVRALSDSSITSIGSSDVGGPVAVRAGRPDLDEILRGASATCEGEMGVAVCGPLGMTRQVRNRVAEMQFGEGGKRAGTYLHVEGFCW